MTVLQYRTVSNRTVAAMSVERDTVFWDRELTGSGVRVYPTGGKVFVAQARGPDGPKRVTVGRHPVLAAEQARQRAALIIARVKAGEDPVPVLGLLGQASTAAVSANCPPPSPNTARRLYQAEFDPAAAEEAQRLRTWVARHH